MPLARLGLTPGTALVVAPEEFEHYWDENYIGFFIITADHPIPSRLDALMQKGQINSRGFGVSPNGQWIVIQRKPLGGERATPWVSSSDGKQQWPLISDRGFDFGQWLDDETILLSDRVTKTGGTIRLSAVQVLNPFTLEGSVAENLPDLMYPGIGWEFYRYAGRDYLLYQGDVDYRLRDVFAQTDQPILQWLRDDPADLWLKGVTIMSGGRAIIRVERPYGFDISKAMSPEEMVASRNSAQTMRPMIFPQAIMPASAGSLPSSNSGVGVFGADGRFYWLDDQRGILKDYCLSVDGFSLVSMDGKFIAFEHLSLPHTRPIPKTTLILNLETGYASKLDKYGLIGWLNIP